MQLRATISTNNNRRREMEEMDKEEMSFVRLNDHSNAVIRKH